MKCCKVGDLDTKLELDGCGVKFPLGIILYQLSLIMASKAKTYSDLLLKKGVYQ